MSTPAHAVDVPVQIDWRLICSMACRSLCTGVPMENIIGMYIDEKMRNTRMMQDQAYRISLMKLPRKERRRINHETS